MTARVPLCQALANLPVRFHYFNSSPEVTRDKDAALTFMKKALKRHGSPEKFTTHGLLS